MCSWSDDGASSSLCGAFFSVRGRRQLCFHCVNEGGDGLCHLLVL